MEKRLFTSESVTEGHPDKICDQISDAVLDALLEQDPMSRVACETAITTGLVLVMGEVTTTGYVDIQKIGWLAALYVPPCLSLLSRWISEAADKITLGSAPHP